MTASQSRPRESQMASSRTPVHLSWPPVHKRETVMKFWLVLHTTALKADESVYYDLLCLLKEENIPLINSSFP